MRITTSTSLLIGSVAAAIALGACGSDDEVTHDEFFDSACEALVDLDPGFEQFFSEHPDPTLADWAAFLPTPRAVFVQMRAVADLPHPEEDDADLAVMDDAFATLLTQYDEVIAAAEAGDQARFDEIEAAIQGVHLPAAFDAMAAVDPRDCPGSEG